MGLIRNQLTNIDLLKNINKNFIQQFKFSFLIPSIKKNHSKIKQIVQNQANRSKIKQIVQKSSKSLKNQTNRYYKCLNTISLSNAIL